MGLHRPADDPQILRGICFISPDELLFVLPAEYVEQSVPVILLQCCAECRDGVFGCAERGLWCLLRRMEQWCSQGQKNKDQSFEHMHHPLNAGRRRHRWRRRPPPPLELPDMPERLDVPRWLFLAVFAPLW